MKYLYLIMFLSAMHAFGAVDVSLVPGADLISAQSPAGHFVDAVNVEDFGAVGDGRSDDTIAIQAALDSLDGIGGIVYAPGQFYKCTQGLKIPSGVILQGRGVGLWDTIIHNRPKQWTGTSLLFHGTGLKNQSFVGVTDQPNTGGWRVVGGETYKLSNWMNSDARGSQKATPKLFSAAITNKEQSAANTHAHHWGLRNIRIVPWMGADGYSDYSDRTNRSLGADWDVGVFSHDSEYERFENVQVVGYWREAGTLRVQPGYLEYAAGERGSFNKYVTQGYRGLVLRATDIYPIINATATTVEIPWHDSQYWKKSSYFEVPGGKDYKYTGLSKVEDKLLFTGVTPDASSLANSLLRSMRRGTGVAGSSFTDTHVLGLNHVSGLLATQLGFAEAAPSFEISGFPLRGYSFSNFKVQNSNKEPINSIFGNCDDILMSSCQFEKGKVIAAPSKADQLWATYPGSVITLDMRLTSTVWSSIDKSLFTPRIYFDDSESFNPQGAFIEDDIITTQSGRDKVIRKAQNMKFELQDYDGSVLLQVFGASGNFGAGSDNRYAFGTNSFRWSALYGVSLRPGTGSPIWTSGKGSPEGRVTANPGSLYTDEDGGVGATLYVKELGRGKDGWIAK